MDPKEIKKLELEEDGEHYDVGVCPSSECDVKFKRNSDSAYTRDWKVIGNENTNIREHLRSKHRALV